MVTNDDEMAKKIQKLKDFGRIRGGIDIHDMVGWNHKFTDIQATVGIEQMKKLPWRVDRMRQIWRLYSSKLRNVCDKDGNKVIEMMTAGKIEEGWIPWFIDVYVPKPKQLQLYLKNKGIGSREVYPPLNSQPCFPNLNGMQIYPKTVEFASKGLWLPSSSALSDTQVLRVCDAIAEFFGNVTSKL